MSAPNVSRTVDAVVAESLDRVVHVGRGKVASGEHVGQTCYRAIAHIDDRA